MEGSNGSQRQSAFCIGHYTKYVFVRNSESRIKCPYFLFGISIVLIFITSNLQKQFCFFQTRKKNQGKVKTSTQFLKRYYL